MIADCFLWDNVKRSLSNLTYAVGDNYESFSDSSALFDWAENAWKHLIRTGFIPIYEYRPDTKIVELRYVTLAALYGEFCELARFEAFKPDYDIWFDEINLEELFIEHNLGLCLDNNDDGYCKQVIETIVELNRATTYNELVTAFGGKERLFYSLWRSMHNKKRRCKGQALQWVKEGMPSIRK